MTIDTLLFIILIVLMINYSVIIAYLTIEMVQRQERKERLWRQKRARFAEAERSREKA